MADFDAERFAARVSDLLLPLLGRPTELLPFDRVRERLGLASVADRGVREVRLDRIVGTLDREREFTRAFRPRDEALRERWERIRRLTEGPRGVPPVELYQVGEIYFVVDGHHRVSVLRSLGAATIEAHVREFRTPLEVGAEASLESLEQAVLERTRADFLEATGIVPGGLHDFRASEVGAYQRLLDHVEKHRYFRGLDDEHCLSWPDAVVSWLERVYRPMARVVRESGLLELFPGWTETDLYLLTMDHLYLLRESGGAAVPMERGVESVQAAAPRRRRRRPAPGAGG